MLASDTVCLRAANNDERAELWHAIYVNNPWKQFDAPFTPLHHQSRFQFRRHLFKRLNEGKTAKVIDFNGKAVGYLSYYWEDEHTRWLEVGITIFHAGDWDKHIGRRALTLWISHLFATLTIARVGLTTWSGNPRMMKCAETLGMQLEGRLRKVRFFQGHYYDSLRYGVLREEWQAHIAKEKPRQQTRVKAADKQAQVVISQK